MALPLDQVKVVDADTHMTEAPRPVDEAARRRRIEDRVPHVAEVDGAGARGSSRTARCSAGPAPAASSTRTARRAGRSRVCTSGRSSRRTPAAYDPVARMELLDEIGIWAQIIFPDVVGLGGQSLGDIVAGRRLAQPLPRDLQRRQRRDAGRVGRPAAADGDPARVGHRRVRARGAARARPRPARREHHVGPAGPRRARPREPRVGSAVGGVRRRWSCRCTSTSAPASRR